MLDVERRNSSPAQAEAITVKLIQLVLLPPLSPLPKMMARSQTERQH